MKLITIGHHPYSMPPISRVLHRGLKITWKHYKECEDNCFPRLFYGNLMHMFALVCFAVAFLFPFIHRFFVGDFIPAFSTVAIQLLIVVVGFLSLLVSRFAIHTYCYEDIYEEMTGNGSRSRNIKKKVQEIIASGKIPPEVLEQLKEQMGADDLRVIGSGVDGVFMLEATKDGKPLMPPIDPNENPIDRIIRESQAIARKNKGGGGAVS